MERSPNISICIPMYNAARFIKDCIDSVLSQSFQDLELLVVDCANPECSNQCTINYCGPTTPTAGPSGTPTPTVTTMCIGL